MIRYAHVPAIELSNQYNPVLYVHSSIAGKDVTRPVGARVVRAQIYAMQA